MLVGCGAGNLLVCDLVSLHMESIAQVYTGNTLHSSHAFVSNSSSEIGLYLEDIK